MSTYAPAVSKRPSISRRFNPLSMTCVRPRERGFPARAGTSRNEDPSKACIDVLQLLARAFLHIAVDGVAVGVDADGQRSEVLDAELPQALGHELLPGDLFDLFDLGRLERRGPADDREVDHSESLHGLDRLVGETALPAERAYAVALTETLGETDHARARRRSDADLLVATGTELADAGRGVEEEGAGEIHRRLHSLIEDPDLRAVADPDDVALHDDFVTGAQLQDLGGIGDRKRDLVRCHHASLSYVIAPSAETCAEARRGAPHRELSGT